MNGYQAPLVYDRAPVGGLCEITLDRSTHMATWRYGALNPAGWFHSLIVYEEHAMACEPLLNTHVYRAAPM